MHQHKTHIKAARQTAPIEKVLASVLDRVLVDRAGPILIAIGGPGGTGKSTLSGQLAATLGDAAVLALDDYKTRRGWRQSRNVYGPHPEANKLDLIREHLVSMRAGESFDRPVYCSEAGEARDVVQYVPRRYNIIEGEVSTYREFRELIDFAIFVDSDWTTQLNTRVSRDVEQRGYSREKAIATFLHSNLREFEEYGAESKKWADVHVHCRHDYHLELESIAQEYYGILESVLPGQLESIQLEGLVVPPCTPFDDEGRIDERAYVEHLEFLAGHGVQRLLVNGTTAEFFSLLPPERRELLTIARRYFPGLILFNTGSDSLAQAKEAARWGEDYGADAIVAMTPYYYADAGEDGLVECLQELGASVDLPMALYNFSRHTGNALTPSILKRVEHLAVKDSSGDLDLIPATPCYLAGSSTGIVERMAAGAKGFVSALACVMPDRYVALETSLQAGETERAEEIQRELRARATGFTLPCEIAAMKRDLSRILPGYPVTVRPPLTQA